MHIYINQLKVILRQKDMLFWIFAFPILLATLFYFTMTNLDVSEGMTAVPAAVADNEAYRADASLRAAILAVGASEDAPFDFRVMDESEALAALEKGEISAVLYAGVPLSVTYGKGGDNTSRVMVKAFADNFEQMKYRVSAVAAANPAALADISALTSGKIYTDFGGSDGLKSNTVIYFYTIFAMLCIYGGSAGQTVIESCQANMSPLGQRRAVSPASGFLPILTALAAAITVVFMSLLLCWVYMRFALDVDLSDKTPAFLLTLLCGSALGTSFGAFMTTVLAKAKSGVKSGLIVGIGIAGAHLSGMSNPAISYILRKNVPPVYWLNPAARITDALRSLYYYGDFARWGIFMAALLAMTAVFALVATFKLRRQSYECV
ncbi:MAG: ABC transporter permease [Oscillospiraceae bacterium]|jgi:ABC-2 type transport system permease protein|nr:ABC transporter permease [Oscillospiraceae bacterium]